MIAEGSLSDIHYEWGNMTARVTLDDGPPDDSQQALEAVSYTHLDVYKRQPVSWSATGLRILSLPWDIRELWWRSISAMGRLSGSMPEMCIRDSL